MTIFEIFSWDLDLISFFKYFIRDILEHGEYNLSGETKVHRRNAAIIYSGGDDVFIVVPGLK